jgi:hypothetical protein
MTNIDEAADVKAFLSASGEIDQAIPSPAVHSARSKHVC